MIEFKPHPASTVRRCTFDFNRNQFVTVWMWPCECTLLEFPDGMKLYPCTPVGKWKCLRDAEVVPPPKPKPEVYGCTKCSWRGETWKLATLVYPQQENHQDDDGIEIDVCPACRGDVEPMSGGWL
jgi:hypothetical protein